MLIKPVLNILEKKGKIIFILILFTFVNYLFSQKRVLYSKTALIVKFKPAIVRVYQKNFTEHEFGIVKLDLLNTKYGLSDIKLTGHKRDKDTYLLIFEREQDIPGLAKIYFNTQMFEYVEPDYIGKAHGVAFTPDDTFYYNRQWAHYNDGTFAYLPSTADADMDTDSAWDITQGDPDIIVAILDSGVNINHPEFSGRFWQNTGESLDGTDTDGNGYIDDVRVGWNFANNNNNPSDGTGHGTNVTGIALATGNNVIGYAGVNWFSKIMVCRILDDNGYGYYSWWASAIYYAVDNGADVINLSVGGSMPSTLMEDAVNYAYNHNVPVVVSAGNENASIQYPAKYAHAFAIGSTAPDDTRSVPFFWSPTSGSNYGPELDFVAPGSYIFGLSANTNANFNTYWSGTSQAAPHVTGVISLLLSINSNLTVGQVETILQDSAEDQVGNSEDTPGWDQYYGYGRINAYDAVTHSLLTSPAYSLDNLNITVYPNPLSKNENLSIINIPDGNYTIDIYNILNEQVYHLNDKAIHSKIKLPVLHFIEKGVYLLKLQNRQTGKIIHKKIIVK